jgi:cell division transport system permease protein
VLSVGGIAVLAMMLFVALFVIVNTVRIAVHARRDEIEIMQLVGATDWFVSWPFILEGMLVGIFGAIVALAVLAAAAGPVTTAMIGFLDLLPISFGANFVLQLALGVLGFALVVGGAGASFSVRSQLAKGAHA